MKVGLIGNQNCGKTTVFNELTGLNAKVGNWPGVIKSCYISNWYGLDFSSNCLSEFAFIRSKSFEF